MVKILFICHGNICRSPMAEFVFRDMAAREGLEVEVASAATSAEEIGNPVYPPVRRLLLSHGLDPAGKRATAIQYFITNIPARQGKPRLTGQALQKRAAAEDDVVPAGIEVARVPGVGNVAPERGEVQQTQQLVFGIASKKAFHAADVGAVHADDEVPVAVLGAPELPRRLARWIEPMFQQQPPHRRINRGHGARI